MKAPVIQTERFILRPWRPEDAPALVKHANHAEIALQLRDAFPHPYTPEDARSWLALAPEIQNAVILAIEVEGEAAGGIGLTGLKDVYRYSCEIGYWLSKKYWGRGIATAAVGEMVRFAFTEGTWIRLFACIFENNPASMRVLEKNGFRKEAIHRKAVYKQGKIMDEHLYVLLRDQWTEK